MYFTASMYSAPLILSNTKLPSIPVMAVFCVPSADTDAPINGSRVFLSITFPIIFWAVAVLAHIIKNKNASTTFLTGIIICLRLLTLNFQVQNYAACVTAVLQRYYDFPTTVLQYCLEKSSSRLLYHSAKKRTVLSVFPNPCFDKAKNMSDIF